MRKFYQNKLWRDKLIKMREEKGAVVHIIPLAHAEYKEEINLKLIEEANELYEADTHAKMVDEIADILESIDCITEFHGITKEEVLKHKEAKFLQFGSYKEQTLVDYVEYPEGSEEELKCLENSEKYPELFEEDFEEDLCETEADSCCSKK
jgi:predicted house-cleaning noncanonical NTP pyrophosphatase (MazG superfamily)